MRKLIIAIIVFTGFLVLFNAVNGEVVNPLGVGHYAAATWSPEGRYLAFARDEDLWTFEPRTNQYQKIVDAGNVEEYWGLAWQNAQMLWFIATRNRVTSLNKVDISTGEFTQVMELSTLADFEIIRTHWAGFTFTESEHEMVFAQSRQFLQLFLQDLYRLDLTDMSITQLTETVDIDESSPSVSPDHQYFAYGGMAGLTVVDTAGASRLIPNVYADTFRYTWSPESNGFLTYGGYRAGEPGLYFVAFTGEQRQLRDGNITSVSWSPDGEYIAYTNLVTVGRSDLHIVPSSTLGLALPLVLPEVHD